jgi:hypothetical protein
MADQRKTFRPRFLVLGASCLLVGSFLPALAEDAGLKNGAAALDAGKYDSAVRMLSSTINSDTASPGDAAKALYLRGIAYRKLGQSAHAISDLGAAIFLGLPDQDRVKALVNRGLAYQAAGLSTQGEAEIAQARRIGGGGTVDQLVAEGGGAAGGAAVVASVSSGSGTTGQWTTTASNETGGGTGSGNRVSRWWGSLTGSSSSSPEPSPPAESTTPAKTPPAPSTGWGAQTQPGEVVAANTPPPAPSTGWGAQTQATSSPVPSSASLAPAPSRPAQAPSTGWGAQTQTGNTVVASDAAPSQSRWSRWFSRTAEADQAVSPQPAPATGGSGGFQLQLANSRSEAEAKALWKQVSSANAALASKSPDIEKVDIGNFGTFYSLRTGPFPDKAESTKVCNALKRNGIDCLVVWPGAQ